MKATIKLFKSDGESDLGYPVKLTLAYQYRKRRKTICHSRISDWDLIREVPKDTHNDFEDMYGRISNIRVLAGNLKFREMENFDEAFDYLLGTSTRSKKKADFFQWGYECVALLESQNKLGTAKSYLNSLTALKKFSPQLKFSELSPYFLTDFKNHCRSRGNSNKTIKHYGGALKAIYNRAVDSNVTEDKAPFKGFAKDIPTRDRRKKQRYLELESIRQLEAAKLPEGQRRAVDLSLLQFYLGGADFVDIYYLKSDQLTNGRIFFTRQKNSELAFEFDVLLTEKAKTIIEKYRVPGEYVFPWRKDAKGYDTFISNQRRALRKVQEILEIKLKPRDEKLTTKVMRHSFATLGKFARVHEDMLREMMGHERKDIDTAYKAKFFEHERDAAQLKIIGEKEPLVRTRSGKLKVKVRRK